MKTFKTLIVSTLLLILVGASLWALRGWMSGSTPSSDIVEDYPGSLEEGVEDDVFSQQMKQYQGIVKPIGVSIYGEGTHRLEQDDRLLAVLESEKVNLLDFEQKEVKVRGFVRDTEEGGQKIMEVAFLEIVAESGVKAFNEVGYEFSFSYPADWEVNKELDKVTFSRLMGDEEEKLMIVYQFEDVRETLEKWLADRDQNLFYDESQITVGEVSGVRRIVKNGDQQIIKVYAKQGKNAYEIRLVSQDEVIRQQYYSIVDFFKTRFEAAEEEPLETEDEDELETEAEEDAAQEEAEETTDQEADEAPADEEVEEAEESTESEEADESSSESLSVSSEEAQAVLDKGFNTFEGRQLSFDYPKPWYFAHIGGGVYGMTTEDEYKEAGEEINSSNSMIMIGTSIDESCAYKKTRKVEDTNYTVCARQESLASVADKVLESVK